jgi:hypothetical protein
VAIPYRRFGKPTGPVSKGEVSKDFLTLENGTDPLSRNNGKELPLLAAQHPRRAQISYHEIFARQFFGTKFNERLL